MPAANLFDNRLPVATRGSIARFAALLVALLCAFAAPQSQARPPDSEIYALQQAGFWLGVSQTGIYAWSVKRHWTDPVPNSNPCLPVPDGWTGVTCDSNDHIIGLSLPYNNVHGNLPPASVLNDLPMLQTINLNGNYIAAQIPELAGLVHLQDFEVIGGNDAFGGPPQLLSGPIPSLAGLTSLQTFRVSSNALSGTLDSIGLAGLTALSWFEISHNQIGGTLPPINGLANLEIYEVADNLFTGPAPAIAGMQLLSTYDVGQNALSGHLPDLSNTPFLVKFRAWFNAFTGSLPNLNNHTYLSTFQVSNNQLSGSLPCISSSAPCNASVPAMLDFEVDHNQFTGPFASLIGAENLEYLDISYNRLSGHIGSPAHQYNLIAKLCPNNFDLSPQDTIDAWWDNQTVPNPWWGPAGAIGSCDLILRTGFD